MSLPNPGRRVLDSILLMDELLFDISLDPVVEIIGLTHQSPLFSRDPGQLLLLYSITESAQIPVGLDDFRNSPFGFHLQYPYLDAIRGEDLFRPPLRYIHPYRGSHNNDDNDYDERR